MIFAKDYSAMNYDTESTVATVALILANRDRTAYRPCARPQMLSREVRIQSKSFWSHYALWDRKKRISQNLFYFPPCLVCATMTGSWCDECKMPYCTNCERERIFNAWAAWQGRQMRLPWQRHRAR